VVVFQAVTFVVNSDFCDDAMPIAKWVMGLNFIISAIICFVLTGHLYLARDHPGDANSGVTVTNTISYGQGAGAHEENQSVDMEEQTVERFEDDQPTRTGRE
jgi:hypothetical protein